MVTAASPLSLVLPVSIRPITDQDGFEYCRGSWTEAHKHSPGHTQMPWGLYKRHVRPHLEATLIRPDTKLVGAYHEGVLVGWVALSPGRRVSTVHWTHTRYGDQERGELYRRRGVMRQLFEAAVLPLGSRLVYTHQGPYPKHNRSRGERKRPADEWIVRWLAKRGVSAAYVSMEEWLK